MKRLSAYRTAIIEKTLAGKYKPIVNMLLDKCEDKDAEKVQSRADIEALTCDSCENKRQCAYRDSVDRLPAEAGGLGTCLRFNRERLGISGFFLPNGEPVLLTDEVVNTIREALGMESE